MLKIENLEIVGMEAAIRGMRNPMNSWDKSDSCVAGDEVFDVGPNDFKSAMNLAKGGPVHGKFKRMINVYCDITAPLYWWKEFDTYKIGTNCNSCSTMHKIHAKDFTIDDFSVEHLLNAYWDYDTLEEGYTSSTFLFNQIIDSLNHYRELFIAVKKRLKDNEYGGNDELKARDSKHAKQYWWQMIQLLPTSYNQRRTIELNYEVLTAMHRDRKNHKLDEWHTLCDMIDDLPYSELITVKPTYV